MQIRDDGDEDAHFWVAEDEAGNFLASGRDYSQVLRDAINKANKELKRE